jgi:hypothetical protein
MFADKAQRFRIIWYPRTAALRYLMLQLLPLAISVEDGG